MPNPIGVNLKPEQRVMINHLYLQGKQVPEIALELDVAESTVYRQLNRSGIREKVQVRNVTKAEEEEIQQFFLNHFFSKEIIAIKLNVPVNSVYRVTKGLTKGANVSEDTIAELAKQYINSEITAETAYQKIGLRKQDLYRAVTKEAMGNA